MSSFGIAKAPHIFVVKISMYLKKTLATTVNKFVINKLVNNALSSWAQMIYIEYRALFSLNNKKEIFEMSSAKLFEWCLAFS